MSEGRKLVDYGECKCVLTQYCDGTCNPIFEDVAPVAPQAAGDGEFKNFHRLLCDRFGYVHDEKDWKRDQLSLIEWIAARATAPQSKE